VACGGRDARAPCIDDTAVERRKKTLRPENAVRLATSGVAPRVATALHDAGASIGGSKCHRGVNQRVMENHSRMAADGESPETTEWIKHATARRSPASAQIVQGSLFQMISQKMSQCSGCHRVPRFEFLRFLGGDFELIRSLLLATSYFLETYLSSQRYRCRRTVRSLSGPIPNRFVTSGLGNATQKIKSPGHSHHPRGSELR
jgi:hypothetical protein